MGTGEWKNHVSQMAAIWIIQQHETTILKEEQFLEDHTNVGKFETRNWLFLQSGYHIHERQEQQVKTISRHYPGI